ncbi:arabinose isomerase [Dyadobacter sp. 3J3]|uniref:arabinose isomerase n=1 Tax=Dyadobacter sp. 3J3 TaxID=2606600 RepID=UPI00135A2047|nr:arabinose isomerase [Dyadobacter sp. 3J3]
MHSIQQNSVSKVFSQTSDDDKPVLKIGLFGIGLDTYWPQFEGLKQRLSGYLQIVEQSLEKPYTSVINLGIIDNAQHAIKAGHQFRQADVEIIFIYATTYALSATVLPVVRRLGVPVVILNLSPAPAIDYARINSMNDRTRMTGEWLAFCGSCPVPEIMNVLKRSGIAAYQVTGMLHGDPIVWEQIDEWIEASRVANSMSYNNLGLLGNYYNGMLDIYSDPTLQLITFGGNVTILEVDELSALREAVGMLAIQDKVSEFYERFDIQADCSIYELERSARTSVALDQLVDRHELGSLAYYHKGTGNPSNEDTMSSIILGTSLLTARGIPVAGEYEIKNVQAMKIMDCFGVGGSFTEYYAMDYTDDVVLMGHDGPGHIQIAQGKTKVRPLEVYHGKVGSGLSVEMSVRNGPVTMLSVVETNAGKLMLLVAEGESVEGPILEIGNTNSRYRFSPGARAFVELWNGHGPAHHCAVGIGHIGSRLKKLGEILKIDVVQIC